MRAAMAMVTIALLFASCKGNAEQKPNQEETTQPQDTPAELIKAPEQIISLEQAEAIYNNYSAHRVPLIENYETKRRAPQENFEVARFVDFDLAVLKQYIAYVEQEAQSAGVEKVTNMRIYFANYPNEQLFSDGKAVVHPRQNSLFLVPTLEKGGEHYAFYIGDDGKPALIIDRTTNGNNGMGSLFKNNGKSHASLVPSLSLNTNLYRGTSLTLNRSGSGPPPHSDF